MPYSTSKDGTRISYADYGNPDGQLVVLIHGWPLSHRMWEKQILALTEHDYRVIAYDRRGFGESDKPWNGYDYDTMTGDLATIIDELDLRDISLVGFSMGGGEVARYIGTHGGDRIKNAVLMSAVTPYLSKTDDNPDGADPAIFEQIVAGLKDDRPEFLDGFTKAFFNWDDSSDTHLISKQSLQHAWDMGVWASPKATIACAEAFASTDFRSDIEAMNSVKTLVLHGDSDQTVPFEISGKRVHEMLPDSELVIIKGGPHGLTLSHPGQVSEALLKFLGK